MLGLGKRYGRAAAATTAAPAPHETSEPSTASILCSAPRLLPGVAATLCYLLDDVGGCGSARQVGRAPHLRSHGCRTTTRRRLSAPSLSLHTPPQATDEFWFPPAINADSRPPALPGVNSPEQAREVQGLGGGTPPLHGAGALPSTPEAPGLLGGRAKRRPDCAWGAGCAWYVCRTTLTPP